MAENGLDLTEEHSARIWKTLPPEKQQELEELGEVEDLPFSITPVRNRHGEGIRVHFSDEGLVQLFSSLGTQDQVDDTIVESQKEVVYSIIEQISQAAIDPMSLRIIMDNVSKARDEEQKRFLVEQLGKRFESLNRQVEKFAQLISLFKFIFHVATLHLTEREVLLSEGRNPDNPNKKDNSSLEYVVAQLKKALMHIDQKFAGLQEVLKTEKYQRSIQALDSDSGTDFFPIWMKMLATTSAAK